VHPTYNVDWGGQWRYRRVRKLESTALPEKVDELIWRKDIPAVLGRANPAGFQVLYLGDRRDTALTEARIEDDFAVIAEFSIREERSTRIAPIGELTQIQRSGRGFLSGDQSQHVSDLINACEPDEALSLLVNDAFLLDCLLGHDDYEISSHVALKVFEKTPAITAIAFPSRRQRGAINFAVRVQSFWRDFALVAVRHAQVRHMGFGYYQLNHVRNVDRIDNDGKLHWAVELDNERGGRLLGPPFVPTSEQ
jgi:hypothetical protein